MQRRATEAVLAEYGSVRSEILQLNGQIFASVSSTLTLNVIVLGWLLGQETPVSFYGLPTVGIFLLSGGNALLLNRNRIAHRLALFQKYFIEPRIPDICWGRVYFAYRDKYPAEGKLTSLAERVADSGTYILIWASLINVLLLIVIGLHPVLTGLPSKIDWLQVANLVIALALLGLQDWLRRVLTNFECIDSTMKELARESLKDEHSLFE